VKKELRKYTDSELIALIRKGKKYQSEAFSELYDRHSVKVRSFCHYMIQNSEQVEDIFQESFISFFNSICEGKKITNTRSYLYATARNLCMKFFRDKKTTVPFENEQFFVDETNKYDKSEMLALIEKSLQLLDDIYREAFVMREFEGLSYKEIADITETSVSNAKSRVFRAHKQLIEILQPYLKDLAK